MALTRSVPGESRDSLFDEAISVAATEAILPYRPWHALGAHLPAGLAPRALAAVAGIADPGNRTGSLAALLPHLPAESVPAAFALVAELPDDPDDVWTPMGLEAVAPRLPLTLVSEAFAVAHRVTDEIVRAHALLALALRLPSGWAARLTPDRRAGLMAELVSARPVLDDESMDLAWQDLFTTVLPEELCAEALTAAECAAEETRAFVIAGLAPRLTIDLLDGALVIADGLAEPVHRATALVGVLAQLVDDTRLPALAPLLAEVTEVAADPLEPWMQRCLDPQTAHAVPDGSPPLAATWAAVTALADGWQRDSLVARLAGRLPASLLPDVLVDATGPVLTSLAPRLDGALAATAWEAAVGAGNGVALVALAPKLPAALAPQVVASAAEYPHRREFGSDIHPRFDLLRVIAPQVPDDLAAAVVLALVPIEFDILGGAPDVEDERQREATTLTADLLARLPTQQRRAVLAEALRHIEALESEEHRVQSLARVAAHLPADMFATALAVVTGLRHTDRVRALDVLVEWAPLEPLLEAWSSVTHIGDAQAVARVRAVLADSVITDYGTGGPGSGCPDGVNHVGGDRDVDDEDPWNAQADQTDPRVAAATMLPIEWYRARTQARDAVPLPAEPLPALVERFAVLQVTEHAEEARAWALAGLAPYLPVGLLSDALDMVLAIGDPYDRGGALVGLAPYLPAHLRATAMDAAGAIPDAANRDWALAGFAPWLPEQRRRQLINDIASGPRGHRRVRALARLGAYLPDGLVVDALIETRSIDRPATGSRKVAGREHTGRDVARDRAAVVAALVRSVPTGHIDPTIAAVFRRAGSDEVWSGAVIADLASYLPERLTPDLRDAVLALLAAFSYGAELRPLIDRLPLADLPRALAAIEAGSPNPRGIWNPAMPATTSYVLARAHDLLAGSEPARLTALLRDGLALRQKTRADRLIVVEAACRSLNALGGPRAIDACAAILDEVQRQWP